jgi:hypothetical protein
VAALADRIKEIKGKRKRLRSFASVSSNAQLWLLFNGGAILSCTMIRSSSARKAGLFDPRMRVRQDMDFFLRLFLLGGAAHSKSDPVVCIKGSPLQNTEPDNNSATSLQFKYESAMDLVSSIGKIPKELYKSQEPEIRTAVARRWASIAFAGKRAHNYRLAGNCLLRAMWWDYDWGRRLRLVWCFLRDRKGLAYFASPYAENSTIPPNTNLSSASYPKDFA